MKTSEVREKFLNYFSDRDHAVLPSSPSIPHGDKTLLFTNAGMVQFKDIFTGREERSHPRAATVQAVGELTCLQLDEAGFRKVVDALLPAFATRRALYSHAT